MLKVLKASKQLWIFLFFCLAPLSLGFAESLSLDLGNTSSSMIGRLMQIFMVITLVSLAPSILIVVTCFTRFIVVFSFLRTALGTQQSPPNMILVSLALFLTTFVMGPTLNTIYDDAVTPLIEERIDEMEAFNKASKPIGAFMLKNTREKDLSMFFKLAKEEQPTSAEKTPLRVLIPAFIISELRRAFEIGFLIFIPFLVIDMVVSSVLMAMGMMMLPPVMISLPFKIIFFVLVDGWHLLSTSLVNSVKV